MDSPSKDLKPVPVMLNDVLLAGIDKACGDVGQSRAHFIRIAIAKELEAMGITIDKSAIHPPSRAGKGGRPTHKSKPAGKAPAKGKKKADTSGNTFNAVAKAPGSRAVAAKSYHEK